MSKVLTFSRFFPAYHPKKGQPTTFVEKIWACKGIKPLNTDILKNEWIEVSRLGNLCYPKYHTIRKGNRFKVGDKFSPRVWSGKPYASKQIIIAPDITVVKVWNIKIEGFFIWIDKEIFSVDYHNNQVAKLTVNDGLDIEDFWAWFPCKPGKFFTGQIICWNENIIY